MKTKFTIYHISMIALAVVLNLIGGQIALMLKLPIYLDSMGTMFIAAVYGPFYGMLPSLLSGVILGITVDMYSLYYAPVGIFLGLLAGFVWRKKQDKRSWFFLGALMISVPTSFLSALITAYLFGGITSSGSTFFVQLLAKTPLGLTMSCFVVQVITDYIDRMITLLFVAALLKKLPTSLLHNLKRHAER